MNNNEIAGSMKFCFRQPCYGCSEWKRWNFGLPDSGFRVSLVPGPISSYQCAGSTLVHGRRLPILVKCHVLPNSQCTTIVPIHASTVSIQIRLCYIGLRSLHPPVCTLYSAFLWTGTMFCEQNSVCLYMPFSWVRILCTATQCEVRKS